MTDRKFTPSTKSPAEHGEGDKVDYARWHGDYFSPENIARFSNVARLCVYRVEHDEGGDFQVSVKDV